MTHPSHSSPSTSEAHQVLTLDGDVRTKHDDVPGWHGDPPTAGSIDRGGDDRAGVGGSVPHL